MISGMKTTEGNVHDSSQRYFDGVSTAPQQPRGEFASAASTTRTKNARLQIIQISSALCFRPRGRLQHVQRATAFDQPFDRHLGWLTVANRFAVRDGKLAKAREGIAAGLVQGAELRCGLEAER